MHSNFRLILWLVIGATLVASLFDVLQIHFERERLEEDLGRRAAELSQRLAENIQSFKEQSPESLQMTLERFGNSEQLMGVGLFDDTGSLLAITPGVIELGAARSVALEA